MSQPRCEDCHHFVLYDGRFNGKTIGECHRYAPKPWSANATAAFWPTIPADSFCGEFLHKNDWPPPQPMACPHGRIGATCHLCMRPHS